MELDAMSMKQLPFLVTVVSRKGVEVVILADSQGRSAILTKILKSTCELFSDFNFPLLRQHTLYTRYYSAPE